MTDSSTRSRRDLTDPLRALHTDDLEAGLKEPEFGNLEIPEDLGTVQVVLDDHKIKRYAFTHDDHHPWALAGSPFFDGARVGQAALLGNDLVQLFTLVYAGSRVVGYHTEEQMWFDSPAALDEVVTLHGTYTEAYERRGEGYVVMEATATGADGRSVVRHRGVEILKTNPGAIGGRGSAAPERRVSGEVPAGARFTDALGPDVRAGDALEPLGKTVTAEQAAVFSRIGEYVRNIHNDIDLARAGGLRVPIVQGQQQFGVLAQLLTLRCGPAFLTSGWLRVKFLAPLDVFEPFTSNGIVTAVTPVDGGLRVDLEVWIRRDRDRRLMTAGWAAVTLPAS
ncbi:dehydratase [Streptomyces zinciresistens K42]|uniref:Dehydratase n=1 Tax=Streptomyces zinciresistens K42 TaxID=700597 RepID=G2G9T2_9ACTN|nr:MaoC family dehydratase [Streptomyces zinciresistens]EGX59754.1 dehydratase [Streptomyces zinciresistens K42]